MLINELYYKSYWTYTPHPNSDGSRIANDIKFLIKNDKAFGNPPTPISEIIANKIKDEASKPEFKDFFGSDVHLVPAPKSSLMKPNTVWFQENLAKSLSKKGLGIFFPCLERFKEVKKAAFCKDPKERPLAIEHYNTIRVKPQIQAPKKIIVIDDIITSGTALLGCASLLHKHFPTSDIFGFAVMKTISEPEKFKQLSEPHAGKIIRRKDGRTWTEDYL